MSRKEPKINEVFEVEGASFKCLKTDYNLSCGDACDLFDTCLDFQCEADEREDGTDVVFKKVDENAN